MHISSRSKMSIAFTFFALAAVIVGLLASAALRGPTSSVHAAGNQVVRQISRAGTASITSTPLGKDGLQAPEINSASAGLGNAAVHQSKYGVVNRSGSQHSSTVSPSAQGATVATSSTALKISFNSINHRQQRLANNGNQFSLEPPDQGLCVGNGFVLETVNDTLRIFDTAGNAVSDPIGLNSFYGYTPAIDRTKNPLQFGPSITDPSCLFDVPTQRWFHVVLTLDRASITTQSLAGTNHLDVAVSATADPTGAWNVYRLPVQDDGTQGTPDHQCQMRVAGKLVHGPCLGDYPHIGADANGFYITTNEFNLFSPGFFHAAQIYAFSKAQLAAGAGTVNVVQFDTSDPTLGVQLDGTPGFTVWPAISTGNQFEGSQGGTEYFVSSEAVFQDSGADSRLRLWSVSNTGSLDSMPALGIGTSVINTIPYAVPGRSNQKPADVALATCLSTIHPCVMRVGHTFRRTSPINDGFDLWPAPLSGCEAVTA